MKTYMTLTAAALALAFTSVGATAQQGAKAVRVLIDIGPGGSPFRHAVYADHAGDMVAGVIDQIGLQDGDMLQIKTFGSASLMDHLEMRNLNLNVTFSYRGAKAEDVGSYLAEQIGGLKDITPHDNSDLMAALGHLSRESLCDTHDVTTFILTNGIQVGTTEGPQFTLHNPPKGTPFCGDLIYVGLWVDDPAPVPGLQASAETLFLDLAKMIGFENADIVR